MPEEAISGGDRPLSSMNDCAKQYTKVRSEYLRDHEINIRFLSVGCVISVGCKNVPFTSIKEGMDALNAYVADPAKEVAKWIEIFNKNE